MSAPVMGPIDLFGADLITIDTALHAMTVPDPTFWRRLAGIAAASWCASLAFLALAWVEGNATLALSAVPSALVSILSTRDAARERASFHRMRAEHLRALDEVARVKMGMRQTREGVS